MMKKDLFDRIMNENSDISDWVMMDRIMSEIGYSGCTGTECANCPICETDIYDCEVPDDN